MSPEIWRGGLRVRLNQVIIEAALAYAKAGFSVIPIKADGSKRPPPLSWKPWQSRRPSPYEISQIFRGNFGIAVLGGKVSGGLEMLDFDRAEFIDPWIKKVEEKTPDLVARLPRIRTPKGGAHFYYRCKKIEGNQKLAQEPPSVDESGNPKPNTLIETRGEGGYVLAPPSPAACHPRNVPYEHVAGPPVLETPEITPDERDWLLAAAREFNTWVPTIMDHAGGGKTDPGDRTLPGNDFNDRARWSEILEPAGWKMLGTRGDVVQWSRPGKTDGGMSATTGHCGDNLWIFSSNAQPFEPSQGYTKFAAYTLIHHNGDYSMAAKALEKMGYGNREAAEKEVEEFEKVASEPPKPKELTAFTPQMDYKEKKGKKKSKFYFDGKEFLPEILSREIKEKHRFIATPIDKSGVGSIVYVYRDGYFQGDGAHAVRMEAHRALDKDSKAARLDNVVELIRVSESMDYSKLNLKSKDLVNVQNGMLDWRTGKLVPHDPDYLSTYQIHAEWHPKKKSDALGKFLSEVASPGDILFIEELMGYLMIPETSFHKSFAFIGMPGTGKSTVLKLITHWLGKENVAAIPLQLLETDQFAASDLFGKLANICTELTSEAIEDVGMMKAISTGDTITTQEKYKARYNFQPFCRLVFSANEFPHVLGDRKGAFVNRMIFIEFENIFRGTKAEIKKCDEVLFELPETPSAMLNMAVRGLQRLMENGKFTQSEASKRIAKDYARVCNSVLYFFDEACQTGVEGAWLPRKHFYQQYHIWAKEHGLKPVSIHSTLEVIRSIRPIIEETTRDGYPGLKWVKFKDHLISGSSQGEVDMFNKKAESNEF